MKSSFFLRVQLGAGQCGDAEVSFSRPHGIPLGIPGASPRPGAEPVPRGGCLSIHSPSLQAGSQMVASCHRLVPVSGLSTLE